jgi:hypothetical protein
MSDVFSSCIMTFSWWLRCVVAYTKLFILSWGWHLCRGVSTCLLSLWRANVPTYTSGKCHLCDCAVAVVAGSVCCILLVNVLRNAIADVLLCAWLAAVEVWVWLGPVQVMRGFRLTGWPSVGVLISILTGVCCCDCRPGCYVTLHQILGCVVRLTCRWFGCQF